GLERRRDGKGFERGAWLERIRDHAIAQLGAGELRAVVWVVRGHIGEREHFAALGIQRDECARLCPVALDCGLERGKGKALDLAVDRQAQIGAVLRGADRLHVLDDLSEAILDYAPTAAPATERLLVGELEALLSHVLDIGKAK